MNGTEYTTGGKRAATNGPGGHHEWRGVHGKFQSATCSGP